MRHLAILCLLLPNLIQVLFYKKKVLFLKIPFPYTSLFPSLQKTNDEPKTNQGTPKELPIIKKCFLLILTTSSLLCPLLPHLMRHLVLLCLLPPPKKKSYWGILIIKQPQGRSNSRRQPNFQQRSGLKNRFFLLRSKIFTIFAP